MGIGRGELTKETREWSEYNIDLLRRSFVDESVANAYARISGSPEAGLSERLDFLKSVRKRLELVEEAVSTAASESRIARRGSGQKVFVVHGQDEGAADQVSRFIEQLSLEPVRLSEKPHSGRTLIEKLEDYSDVDYAIAVLTPDDVGAPREKADRKEEWKARARQNVIFELGVFVGLLRRGRVCALYKPDVELPSDYRGVGYVPMGPGVSWKFDVAKEMQAAGLKIDLNKLK